MANSSPFQGRIAFVPGGTSGIGLALVVALAREGAGVRFCARSAGAVDRVSRETGARGYVCDVTNAAEVARMAEAITQADGRLDILIANVGMLREPDFSQAPLDETSIRRELELNLVAPILNVNRLLPLLRKGRSPALVMVGSGFGWSPSGRAPLYSAAKAGIRAFVKALRFQLSPLGIHVMEVVPPVVDTPATRHRNARKISAEAMADATLRGLRAGRREVFAGQTRLLPLMLRLAPRTVERVTGRG